VILDADFAAEYPEAWLVGEADATRIDVEGGKALIQPMVVGRWAVIACDAKECLAVDAFVLDL
jgi:hypothetical protein